MDRLFKQDTMREVGSLLQMKNILDAKQVNTDIKKSYYASENFFNKVTEVLVRIGLQHFKDSGGEGETCCTCLYHAVQTSRNINCIGG